MNPWWNTWQQWTDDQRSIYHQIMRKNFDLVPDDEMNFKSTRTGIGALGAIGIALAAGVPGAGVGLMALQMLANLPQAAPQPPPAPVSPPPAATAPAAAPDVERAFRILFFDKDRNPIEVKPFTPAD